MPSARRPAPPGNCSGNRGREEITKRAPPLGKGTSLSRIRGPRGVVDDDRVRYAVPREFPGGEARALIARPGIVDPDMDGNAILMSAIDRRQCSPQSTVASQPALQCVSTLTLPSDGLFCQASAISSAQCSMAVFAVFCRQTTANPGQRSAAAKRKVKAARQAPDDTEKEQEALSCERRNTSCFSLHTGSMNRTSGVLRQNSA